MQKRLYSLLLVAATGVSAHAQPKLHKDNIKEVVAAMTLKEKAHMVAGSLTSAIVNGIESKGAGTSIQHFSANNQTTNRTTVNTVVSERALREIYLRDFQIAVKQLQPWTAMSSYYKINGTYTSEDRSLLTTISKGEWRFKGCVMTDWYGGKDAIVYVNAGNDLILINLTLQNILLFQEPQQANKH